MNKFTLLIAVAFVSLLAESTSAQIRINIPGIPKPKATPTPTPAATPTPTPTPASATPSVPANGGRPATGTQMQVTDSSSSAKAANAPKWMVPPAWNDQLAIIRETIDVQLDINETYWKAPNEYNYSSWYPLVKFKVAYKGTLAPRLQVEWFNPDGSLWFTDQIKVNFSNVYDSKRDGEKFSKATNMGGTYGLKISDTRSGNVLFEGKFKVSKYKAGNPIPMFKNSYGFAVDHDGELAAGFVGFKWTYDNFAPPLLVSMWLKGDRNSGSVEARLYRDGQEISTTDANGGSAMSEEDRRPVKEADKFPNGYYKLWDFQFPVRYLHAKTNNQYPGTKFLNDADGVYTVKVFVDGEQVREASFNVKGGMVEGNGIAEDNGYTAERVVIPVKVMGAKEKVDPAGAKSGLYMNPIKGIQ